MIIILTKTKTKTKTITITITITNKIYQLKIRRGVIKKINENYDVLI